MEQIPEDIVNRICCEAIKMRGVHPFAEEIKTLNLLNDIIEEYSIMYDVEAFDWLSMDLDNQYPDSKHVNSSVIKKWKSLTPKQRREFIVVII